MKVFIIASLTADGLLARDNNDFVMDWTSPEDVKHFVKLTKEAGVMVMGSRTFETILQAGRKLPGRKIVVYSSRQNAYKPDIRPDPTEVTSEPPAKLVERLKKEGFPAVAICGGAQIYNLFMKAGVVTDIYLTIEPKIFGQGLRIFTDLLDVDLHLVSCHKLNDDTLALHYEVTNAKD
jgi:dihydrofolate reductase